MEHGLHTDLESLKRIGRQRGFPPRLRRKIWMILLGFEDNLVIAHSKDKLTIVHEDETQIALDVNRSFTAALPTRLVPSTIPGHKIALEGVIVRTLRRHPWLRYYQGYHDIAQLIYLVLDDASEVALERLSLGYLRDFMLSSLRPSMSILRLVHQIVRIADPDLADLLDDTEPYYAISALLTWWTHSLQSFQSACRAMDYFLSSDPVMIVYTIAAATISRRKEILSCEGDSDMIFLYLSKGIADENLERVLQEADNLYDSIKPWQLHHWKSISNHSCLKTCETTVSPNDWIDETWQKEARLHFQAQEEELVIEQERDAKKKNPMVNTNAKFKVMAIGFGLLAIGIAWYTQQGDVLRSGFLS